MSRRVVVRPLAKADLDEQSLFMAQDSVAAALRFLDSAETALDRLRELPEVGRIREFLNPELSDVRSWPIPGFDKHVVFYRSSSSEVDVLRVLHSAQDLERVLGPEEK